MSEKKKPSKKSLEFVRPILGEFNLLAFPGVVFKFKKITIDDESWVAQSFGQTTWEIINLGKAEVSTLCRLYFHFLEEKNKALFPPEEIEEMDYETGEKKKNLINGPKKFMRAIDGGSMTEMLLIANAFVKTLIASRPFSDLPEEVKKNLQAQMKKKAPKEENPTEEEKKPEASL